jgi:hypothetical protein
MAHLMQRHADGTLDAVAGAGAHNIAIAIVHDVSCQHQTDLF